MGEISKLEFRRKSWDVDNRGHAPLCCEGISKFLDMNIAVNCFACLWLLVKLTMMLHLFSCEMMVSDEMTVQELKFIMILFTIYSYTTWDFPCIYRLTCPVQYLLFHFQLLTVTVLFFCSLVLWIKKNIFLFRFPATLELLYVLSLLWIDFLEGFLEILTAISLF